MTKQRNQEPNLLWEMLPRKIREMRYQPKGDMGLRENIFREVGLRHIGKLLGLI